MTSLHAAKMDSSKTAGEVLQLVRQHMYAHTETIPSLPSRVILMLQEHMACMVACPAKNTADSDDELVRVPFMLIDTAPPNTRTLRHVQASIYSKGDNQSDCGPRLGHTYTHAFVFLELPTAKQRHAMADFVVGGFADTPGLIGRGWKCYHPQSWTS